MSEPLRMFVITRGTKDYGDLLVVRIHEIGPGTVTPVDPPLWVGGTLEEARGAIEEFAPSRILVPPSPGEDPVIVESWI